MLAVGILARDSRHRTNRLAALLMIGTSLWAACEVLWNAADDPDHVLWLVRISSIGWIAIGPAALNLFLDLTRSTSSRGYRFLPALYGISAVFLVVALGTPWMHESVVRTSWGGGYRFGPAYPLFYAFTVACLSASIALGLRDLAAVGAPGERVQARALMVGIAIPLTVASVTDGLLPMLGWQPPRLGTASFTALGAAFAWGVYRDGYSLLAPGDFASEILDALPDGVALLRLDGRVRSANRGLGQLLGLPPQALEQHRIDEWLRSHSLDTDVDHEASLMTPNGDVPVSVSTAPLHDKQGGPIGRVLVLRDLREVMGLRSRLITSGRLAAVGQLAAGIAHEINNPIAYVNANLGALRAIVDGLTEKLEHGPSEAQELIDESLEGIQRVAAIVRDVKSFSHAGAPERRAIDIAKLLDAVLRVAAPQLRYGRPVERRYGKAVPAVLGDPQELQQVFLNLVINAGQAVRGDQEIRVITRHEHDRVIVLVVDVGCGIPDGMLESVFDPFFTTKRVGEGTGLGLSIAHEIVRRHGGALSVRSALGRGTSFRVELPIADGPGDGAEVSPSASASLPGSRHP
jgi:signal transduction histidine kinase